MALVQKSPEVFFAEGPIAAIGPEDIELLRQAVRRTSKRRARINAHCGHDDVLHEMIIAIEPASYIRPHKHPGKSEAFHIIEGEVDIVVFRDDGAIDEIVALGEKSGGRAFYYRMSAARFHTLVIRSELLIVHEITNGPFSADATIYADFAPPEGDPAATAFQVELIERVRAFQESHP
jgi:cupin fold WbuC family metalloprotein